MSEGMMTGMDLVEFLRARLAEDEEVARAAQPAVWYSYFRTVMGSHEMTLAGEAPVDPEDVAQVFTKGDAQHIARHDPARVLAEVEAKRWIIGLHAGEEMDTRDGDGEEWSDVVCGRCLERFPCRTLLLLALSYASHEDYRAEWKP